MLPFRTRLVAPAVGLLIGAGAAHAQNEAALRAGLEGRIVTVKVDMPATSRGIDIHPERSMSVDWREVAERIKDDGTALRIGDRVMITKVVVKKNSHIEVQLGGGGYGTFGDWMSQSSSVSSVDEGESKAERALRDSIKAAPGPTKRKQFERELSNLRSERERENARARAEAAQANEAREANLRARRAQSGSRFNLRYDAGIPAEVLTLEGAVKALERYLDFGLPVRAETAVTPTAAETAVAPAPGSPLTSLRKGLSVQEVEALLGPADTAGEVKEGSMTVVRRTYRKDGMKVSASFVSGVLIDFAVTPNTD